MYPGEMGWKDWWRKWTPIRHHFLVTRKDCKMSISICPQFSPQTQSQRQLWNESNMNEIGSQGHILNCHLASKMKRSMHFYQHCAKAHVPFLVPSLTFQQHLTWPVTLSSSKYILRWLPHSFRSSLAPLVFSSLFSVLHPSPLPSVLC